MADGHTLNLDYKLVNPQGEVLKVGTKDLTARTVIQEMLLADNPQKPASGAEKALAGKLAFKKLLEDGPLFEPEELALMKKKCEDGCSSLIYFQMEGILNGKLDPLAE